MAVGRNVYILFSGTLFDTELAFENLLLILYVMNALATLKESVENTKFATVLFVTATGEGFFFNDRSGPRKIQKPNALIKILNVFFPQVVLTTSTSLFFAVAQIKCNLCTL